MLGDVARGPGNEIACAHAQHEWIGLDRGGSEHRRHLRLRRCLHHPCCPAGPYEKSQPQMAECGVEALLGEEGMVLTRIGGCRAAREIAVGAQRENLVVGQIGDVAPVCSKQARKTHAMRPARQR